MSDFTSEYKDQDGRVTTRVDTVKSIDSLATIFTWLVFGVFILTWKILTCIFSSSCRNGRYALLGIFFGYLGLHNFYSKQYIKGSIKLIVTTAYGIFIYAAEPFTGAGYHGEQFGRYININGENLGWYTITFAGIYYFLIISEVVNGLPKWVQNIYNFLFLSACCIIAYLRFN